MLQELVFLSVLEYFLGTKMRSDAHMPLLSGVNLSHKIKSKEDIYKLYSTL